MGAALLTRARYDILDQCIMGALAIFIAMFLCVHLRRVRTRRPEAQPNF